MGHMAASISSTVLTIVGSCSAWLGVKPRRAKFDAATRPESAPASRMTMRCSIHARLAYLAER